MGVQVEGGKGRGKSMNAELNLVPFIDFLSCLIAFLMITAVWSEIAALDQEQAVSNSNTPPEQTDKEPVPPLVVHISKDRVRAERKKDDPNNPPIELAKVGDKQDLTKLREWLEKDKSTYPEEPMITIYTEDGVPYSDMMGVLDLSRIVGCDSEKLAKNPKACGYQKTAMAGGPASSAAPAPSGG